MILTKAKVSSISAALSSPVYDYQERRDGRDRILSRPAAGIIELKPKMTLTYLLGVSAVPLFVEF